MLSQDEINALLAGMDTVSCSALKPFLILVSISAIGSVILIVLTPFLYQLAFLTPGI